MFAKIKLIGLALVASSAAMATQQLTFIGVGPEGLSSMKNVVTIYKNSADPQHRCLGCADLRMILDTKNRNMPIGGTIASDVDLVIKDVDGKELQKIEIRDFFSLYRNPWSITEAKFMVFVPSLLRGVQATAEIRLLKKRCLNAADARCSDLVVQDTFLIRDARKLLQLSPIEGRPNSRR